ncbi:MAG: metal-sensitive transcriptional regulator [Deltaproteobacteria bacterium]
MAQTRRSSKQRTVHHEQLPYLKKIEGQVRGVMRMIDEERYCVDIITQLEAVAGAVGHVQHAILKKHLEGCVAASMESTDRSDKIAKIREVLEIVGKLRR